MSFLPYSDQFMPDDQVPAWSQEPRTDSARTDRIMQILAARPFGSSGSSIDRNRPKWGTEQDENLPSLHLHPDGRTIQMAWVGAAPIALRLGQAGINGLRMLGAGAAAALGAILQSFHNRLGRLPTPSELDAALSEQSVQQDSKAATGIVTQDGTPSQAEDSNDKGQCERLYAVDTDTCNGISRIRGKRAGVICHEGASARYAECLQSGLPVRTPLPIWDN